MQYVLLVCAVCFLVYFLSKKQSEKSNVSDRRMKFPLDRVPCNRKTIEGTLNFADVVGWFKQIEGLDQQKDVPFIADAARFEDALKIGPIKNRALFMGVYDEKKDEITHNLCIECNDFDAKTKEVLGDEALVVLN